MKDASHLTPATAPNSLSCVCAGEGQRERVSGKRITVLDEAYPLAAESAAKGLSVMDDLFAISRSWVRMFLMMDGSEVHCTRTKLRLVRCICHPSPRCS